MRDADLLREIASVLEEQPEGGYREFQILGWASKSAIQPSCWRAVFDAFTDGRVRRRPRTIEIAGITIPEPLREAPEEGETYWRAALRHSKTLAQDGVWEGVAIEHTWLRRGLLHANREAARQHARALIKASGGEVGDE